MNKLQIFQSCVVFILAGLLSLSFSLFWPGILHEAGASHLSVISYDFDGGGSGYPEREWSPYRLSFDPRFFGFNFLGKFGNETISLFVMDALEGHGSVGTLAFDLITIGSWTDNNIFEISEGGQYVAVKDNTYIYMEPIVAFKKSINQVGAFNVHHIEIGFPLRYLYYDDGGTSDLKMFISAEGLPEGSSWGIDNFSLDLDNAPVPLPSTITFLGCGLLGILFVRKKNRQA